MKVKHITLNNFFAGEVSSYINDTHSIYNNSAKLIQNLIITPYGILTRRPSCYLVSMLSENKIMKLICISDNENTLRIECYGGIFKFFLNLSPLINQDSLTNNYSNEDIQTLNYIIDYDNYCIYFLSHNYPPCVLRYKSSTTGSEAYNMSFFNFNYIDGPYLPINKENYVLTLSATSGANQSLTCNASFFRSYHLNNYVRIAHNGVWGVCKIKEIISNTSVKIDIITNFMSTEASSIFSMSAWNSNLGYPSIGALSGGRLCFGCSKSYPQTLWFSKLFDYNNFSPTTRITSGITEDVVLSDNAITINLIEGKNVLWINTIKNIIVVGSSEGLFSIASQNFGETISPLNYWISKISDQKSSSLMLNNNLLTFYVGYHKRDIYVVEAVLNKVISVKNIVNNCKHLFTKDIKDILFIDYPFKMLWVLLENGKLLCASIIENNGDLSYAWSSHNFGGLNPIVIQMASSYKKNQSMLWFHISRNNSSSVYQSIEYCIFDDMCDLFFDEQQSDLYYLDGAFNTNIVDNTINNLTFYNDLPLSFVLKEDKIYLGNIIVKNNCINTTNKYANQQILAGYLSQCVFVSNNLDDNEIYAQHKHIDEVILKTLHSKDLSIKFNNQANKEYDLIINTSNLDSSYIYKINYANDFNKVKNLTIAQYNPTPFNLIYIKLKLIST